MRKSWGGDKIEDGAKAAAIVGSVLRTSRTERGVNPIAVLMAIATSDGRHSG